MKTLTRRDAIATFLAFVSLSALGAHEATAASSRGASARSADHRRVDPGIGKGQSGGQVSRRSVSGGQGTGPDPLPKTRRSKNKQGGLLDGLNTRPTGPDGYHHCHPRQRERGLCR